MTEALNEVKQFSNKLVLSVDFTWDSKRSGKSGTLTVQSPFTKKNLFRIHIQRVGPYANFNVKSLLFFCFFLLFFFFFFLLSSFFFLLSSFFFLLSSFFFFLSSFFFLLFSFFFLLLCW